MEYKFYSDRVEITHTSGVVTSYTHAEIIQMLNNLYIILDQLANEESQYIYILNEMKKGE